MSENMGEENSKEMNSHTHVDPQKNEESCEEQKPEESSEGSNAQRNENGDDNAQCGLKMADVSDENKDRPEENVSQPSENPNKENESTGSQNETQENKSVASQADEAPPETNGNCDALPLDEKTNTNCDVIEDDAINANEACCNHISEEKQGLNEPEMNKSNTQIEEMNNQDDPIGDVISDICDDVDKTESESAAASNKMEKFECKDANAATINPSPNIDQCGDLQPCVLSANSDHESDFTDSSCNTDETVEYDSSYSASASATTEEHSDGSGQSVKGAEEYTDSAEADISEAVNPSSKDSDCDDSNGDTLVDDKFCSDMNNNISNAYPTPPPSRSQTKKNSYSRRVSDPTLRYWNVKKVIVRRNRRVRSYPMRTSAQNEHSENSQSEDDLVSQKPMALGHVLSNEQRGLKSLYNLVVSIRTNGSKKEKLRAADLLQLLETKGILASDPRLRETNNLIKKEEEGEEVELQQDVFVRITKPSYRVVRKALLNHLTIPGFEFFKSRMSRIFDAVSSTLHKMDKTRIRQPKITSSSTSYISVMLKRRADKASTFCMAVCTVDGQQLSFGNKDTLHPLNSCANVLNYCEACRQNGIETVESFIGNSPLPKEKDEFSADDEGRVWNPFSKAGAVMTSALLLRGAESTESRLAALHESYSKAMGGEPIWCDNLSYNLKRLYEHEEISLAYYLSARDKLPRFHALTPGDALELNFQSSSTATSCDRCAVAAATLAAGGVCPFTGETVFKDEIVQHTLERMRCCNTLEELEDTEAPQEISMSWSDKGSIFLIVPGVMGVTCFAECQPEGVMKELVKCLVQNLLSTFNFSVYRSLKRQESNQAKEKR